MKLTKWEFIGVFLISGLGIFLHYAYELSRLQSICRVSCPY